MGIDRRFLLFLPASSSLSAEHLLSRVHRIGAAVDDCHRRLTTLMFSIRGPINKGKSYRSPLPDIEAVWPEGGAQSASTLLEPDDDRFPTVSVHSHFPNPNEGMERWFGVNIAIDNMTFDPPEFETRFLKRCVGRFIEGLAPSFFFSAYEGEAYTPNAFEAEAGIPLRFVPFVGYFPPTVVQAHPAAFWEELEAAIVHPPRAVMRRQRAPPGPWVERLSTGGLMYRLAHSVVPKYDDRLRRLLERELGVTGVDS